MGAQPLQGFQRAHSFSEEHGGDAGFPEGLVLHPVCVERLRHGLQTLHKHGIKLRLTKFKLVKKEVHCVGHLVLVEGVFVEPKDIGAIQAHSWRD